MQALLFLRLCAKGILNHWVVRAGHRAEKFIVLIVYVYSVWLLPIGIKIRWTNSMEKLLTSSYMFGYLCLYLIFIFFLYLIGLISYMYVIFCLFTSFLLALNFAFSKIKMFKLLFILFVIKQLLGNLTSDIDIYSAKLSIIRLGGIRLSGGNSDGNIVYLKLKINGKTSRSQFILIYYWSVIDWKFSWINFVHIFFVYFVKYEFCASLACIYFRKCRLKENFVCI